jgi:putative ABC transport system substrate-binding protein
MRRREFTTLLGVTTAGLATFGPGPIRAQQRERVRRIGVLIDVAADDPEASNAIAGFLQGLQESGWAVGRNVQIEYRHGNADDDRTRKLATELVALGPDVIFSRGGPSIRALQQVTRTIPIVFTNQNDPVGAGIVTSLARPGANITGFGGADYAISVKLLELLKQISPNVSRVAVVRSTRGGLGGFSAIQAVAPSFRVELTPVGVGVGIADAAEMERGVEAFARGPSHGMIVTGSTLAYTIRGAIVGVAARHRLPAVYPGRSYVAAGGLISYGAVNVDQYRRAAGYVDRILRGEKAADLPVQAPVKYETVLNMKTAKALGLEVPVAVLVRADEVIE